MAMREPVGPYGATWTETPMAGYSGTPLAKKLGIKPGFRIAVLNGPGDYAQLLAPMPDGVTLVARVSNRVDLVHLFAASRKQLDAALRRCRHAIRPAAAIWVSWPKKSSGVAGDVNGDTVREIALPMGLVDIKVCAVTDVWSGLKLVIRRELR